MLKKAYLNFNVNDFLKYILETIVSSGSDKIIGSPTISIRICKPDSSEQMKSHILKHFTVVISIWNQTYVDVHFTL